MRIIKCLFVIAIFMFAVACGGATGTGGDGTPPAGPSGDTGNNPDGNPDGIDDPSGDDSSANSNAVDEVVGIVKSNDGLAVAGATVYIPTTTATKSITLGDITCSDPEVPACAVTCTDSTGSFNLDMSGCDDSVAEIIIQVGSTKITVTLDCSEASSCEIGTIELDNGASNNLDYECQSDGDCAEGSTCTEGTCVAEPKCSVDAECGEGSICENGVCVENAPPAACTTDIDCSDNEYCDSVTSTCVATNPPSFGTEPSFELSASNEIPNDYFGVAGMAASNGYLLVSRFVPGVVYAFKEINFALEHEYQQLFPSDLGSGSCFGSSIAMSDKYALIGDYCSNDFSGAVYYFKRDANDKWNEIQKITYPNINYGITNFGYDVSIDGEYAVISMRNSVIPIVHLYHLNNTSGLWVNVARLALNVSEDDCSQELIFAANIKIKNETVILVTPCRKTDAELNISTTSHKSYFFNVFNFSRAKNWGAAVDVITPVQEVPIWSENLVAVIPSGFGDRNHSIDFNDDFIAIGGYNSSSLNTNGQGGVFVYKKENNGLYTFAQMIFPAEPDITPLSFGTSLSLNGELLVVGSRGYSWLYQLTANGTYSLLSQIKMPSKYATSPENNTGFGLHQVLLDNSRLFITGYWIPSVNGGRIFVY